ncbi:hypothetical protein QJS04_geneDACA017127 [Acorus gramineus]|uniref:RGA n=1 Tax=Acorus gramineus TaxID=55184 RepID=A0AAV9AXY5_ACOGR|nr:hypothetical protein QJS04_geneDACA017127 [Acorus gramineus]
MDNLSSLKHLSLLDEKMEDLPDWLQGITTQLQRLELRISPELLRRCVHRDGPEWTKIIKHISHVEGFAHGSLEEFSYIKSSNYFHSNLTDA